MHYPRKRFGQHFLIDENIIDRIIHSLHLKPQDIVVEIGPGLGVLTKLLLNALDHLYAIEIDRDLAEHLRQLSHLRQFEGKKFTLFEQDVLTFDFNELANAQPPFLRLVGNLPYNITTPLLFHVLQYSDNILDMHFMIQKEVADRIVAKPGSKDIGRLSIMLQYFCDATVLFDVPPTAFKPPPKVQSSVIRLKPYQQLPHPVKDFDTFAQIVLKAFNQRRKTIHNSLKEYISDEGLRAIGLDPSLRPENLGLKEFVDITNFVVQGRDKKHEANNK